MKRIDTVVGISLAFVITGIIMSGCSCDDEIGNLCGRTITPNELSNECTSLNEIEKCNGAPLSGCLQSCYTSKNDFKRCICNCYSTAFSCSDKEIYKAYLCAHKLGFDNCPFDCGTEKTGSCCDRKTVKEFLNCMEIWYKSVLENSLTKAGCKIQLDGGSWPISDGNYDFGTKPKKDLPSIKDYQQKPDLPIDLTVKPDSMPDCTFGLFCLQKIYNITLTCCQGGVNCSKQYDSGGWITSMNCSCGNGKSYSCKFNVCKSGLLTGWLLSISCTLDGKSVSTKCINSC